MSTPITISIPHQLGRAEARRRLDGGFGQISQQLTGSVAAFTQRWDGDRLVFSVAGLGQTIHGAVDVQDALVTMQIELPGLLGVIANAVRGRLRHATQRLLTKD
jgi:hypothetical protein